MPGDAGSRQIGDREAGEEEDFEGNPSLDRGWDLKGEGLGGSIGGQPYFRLQILDYRLRNKELDPRRHCRLQISDWRSGGAGCRRSICSGQAQLKPQFSRGVGSPGTALGVASAELPRGAPNLSTTVT